MVDIPEKLSSLVKYEENIVYSITKIIPTLKELKKFISKWSPENFESQMKDLMTQIIYNGDLSSELTKELCNIIVDYCLISSVTPGIIFLIRGAFLFYINELEKNLDQLDDNTWIEIYKSVILNISYNPAEWTNIPGKMLEWEEEFGKHGLQKDRFNLFSNFVIESLP